MLRPGDFEGALETPLRRRHVSFRRQQIDFAGDAMDLRFEVSAARHIYRRRSAGRFHAGRFEKLVSEA